MTDPNVQLSCPPLLRKKGRALHLDTPTDLAGDGVGGGPGMTHPQDALGEGQRDLMSTPVSQIKRELRPESVAVTDISTVLAGFDDDDFSCPKLLPKDRPSNRLLDSPDPQSPQPPPNEVPATQPAAEIPAKLPDVTFDAKQTTLQHHTRGEGAKDASASRLSTCLSANPHHPVPCPRLTPTTPRRLNSTLSLGEPRMTRSRTKQQQQSAECMTPPRLIRREY